MDEKETNKKGDKKFIHIVRKKEEKKIKFLRTFIEKNADKKHMIFILGENKSEIELKNVGIDIKDENIRFIHDESELAEEIMSSECKVIVW